MSAAESIDLDAIEARLEAATPGPWIHGDRWHIQGASQCPCRLDYGPLIHNGPMDINGEVMPSHVHEAPEPFWNHGIWQRPTAETEWAPEVVLIDEAATLLDADADLIANAPTDLAALVAELRATTADLAVAVEVARERGQATADLRAGIEALRDEWLATWLPPSDARLVAHMTDALDALLRGAK